MHILFFVFLCYQDIGSIWLEVSHFTHPELLDLHRHEHRNTFREWTSCRAAVLKPPGSKLYHLLFSFEKQRICFKTKRLRTYENQFCSWKGLKCLEERYKPLCWMSAHNPKWIHRSPTNTPSPGRRGSPHSPCLCTWQHHRYASGLFTISRKNNNKQTNKPTAQRSSQHSAQQTDGLVR